MEVKASLNNFIIDTLLKQSSAKLEYKKSLYFSLANKKLDDFQQVLESIFAHIPYNNFTNNTIQKYEGFYASVVYVYLQSLGLDIIGEDVTNKGRIDLTIKLTDTILYHRV